MTAPLIRIEHLSKEFQSGGGFLSRPRSMQAVRSQWVRAQPTDRMTNKEPSHATQRHQLV